MDCDTSWTQDMGIAVECPSCKGLYIKWVNYEQLRKQHRNKKGPEYGY